MLMKPIRKVRKTPPASSHNTTNGHRCTKIVKKNVADRRDQILSEPSVDRLNPFRLLTASVDGDSPDSRCRPSPQCCLSCCQRSWCWILPRQLERHRQREDQAWSAAVAGRDRPTKNKAGKRYLDTGSSDGHRETLKRYWPRTLLLKPLLGESFRRARATPSVRIGCDRQEIAKLGRFAFVAGVACRRSIGRRDQTSSRTHRPDCWPSESGQGRARTADTGLFRAVLYQLSYLTVTNIEIGREIMVSAEVNSMIGDRRV